MSKIHVEICSTEQTAQKNTGFKDNCLESKLHIPVLSNGHVFPTVADFKTTQSWRDAIASKALVPLFPVYEVADASTEDTLFQSGSFSKVTQKGAEIVTFECYISAAAYAALKSYEGGDYREIFEYNEEGDYSGVFAIDNTGVRGRKISSIEVTRIRATNDKVPYVSGRITYADKNDVLGAVIVKSDLQDDHLVGIFDVALEQVSATASEIKFKAKAGNSLVTSLVSDDLVVKDASGVAQTTSFVAADANGVYTITGTAFAAGYTVEGVGVIVQATAMYEVVEPLAVTI